MTAEILPKPATVHWQHCYVHGFIMNGGVHHCIECLSADQMAAAKAGYRFFGFPEVPLLLELAVDLDGDEADRRYGSIIPQDSTIEQHFKDILGRSPELFAAVK
jgi:hypothetical protein